jgi:hypothetical protein
MNDRLDDERVSGFWVKDYIIKGEVTLYITLEFQKPEHKILGWLSKYLEYSMVVK